MNFLSWNVQGLIDLSRKYYVQDTRRRIGILGILCLQEVKVSDFMLNDACRVIWLDSASFCSQYEAGRGGIVSLLTPHVTFSIIDHGHDPKHIIVWIFLSL